MKPIFGHKSRTGDQIFSEFGWLCENWKVWIPSGYIESTGCFGRLKNSSFQQQRKRRGPQDSLNVARFNIFWVKRLNYKSVMLVSLLFWKRISYGAHTCTYRNIPLYMSPYVPVHIVWKDHTNYLFSPLYLYKKEENLLTVMSWFCFSLRKQILTRKVSLALSPLFAQFATPTSPIIHFDFGCPPPPPPNCTQCIRRSTCKIWVENKVYYGWCGTWEPCSPTVVPCTGGHYISISIITWNLFPFKGDLFTISTDSHVSLPISLRRCQNITGWHESKAIIRKAADEIALLG